MSVYSKLFASILDSSVWLEPMPTRIVWLTLLAAKDQDGFARFASLENLARRAVVSLEEATVAVLKLEAPDPNSSNPDHEGRRIERAPGGWLVLNAKLYDDMVRKDDERRANRDRVRRHRDKKAVLPDLGTLPAQARLSERLLTDDDRSALSRICTTVDDGGRAWLAEAAAALDGMHGPLLTPKALGEALREYVGNGALKNPNFKHFRAYLKRAAVPLRDAPTSPTDQFAALDQWAKDNA